MSFQKCPICQGSGNDPFIAIGSSTNYACPTCNGARIIDEVTGLPPIVGEKHTVFESLVKMRHTITPEKNDSTI